MESEGMGDGTLFPIRSDNIDLPKFTEGFCQNEDPLGIDSIIIGHQNLRTLTHILRLRAKAKDEGLSLNLTL